jgi:hypothetical protein
MHVHCCLSLAGGALMVLVVFWSESYIAVSEQQGQCVRSTQVCWYVALRLCLMLEEQA